MKAIFAILVLAILVRATIILGYFFAEMIVAMMTTIWNGVEPIRGILISSVIGVVRTAAPPTKDKSNGAPPQGSKPAPTAPRA